MTLFDGFGATVEAPLPGLTFAVSCASCGDNSTAAGGGGRGAALRGAPTASKYAGVTRVGELSIVGHERAYTLQVSVGQNDQFTARTLTANATLAVVGCAVTEASSTRIPGCASASPTRPGTRTATASALLEPTSSSQAVATTRVRGVCAAAQPPCVGVLARPSRSRTHRPADSMTPLPSLLPHFLPPRSDLQGLQPRGGPPVRERGPDAVAGLLAQLPELRGAPVSSNRCMFSTNPPLNQRCGSCIPSSLSVCFLHIIVRLIIDGSAAISVLHRTPSSRAPTRRAAASGRTLDRTGQVRALTDWRRCLRIAT